MTTAQKIEKAKNEMIESLKGFSNLEVKEALESLQKELDLRLFVN